MTSLNVSKSKLSLNALEMFSEQIAIPENIRSVRIETVADSWNIYFEKKPLKKMKISWGKRFIIKKMEILNRKVYYYF